MKNIKKISIAFMSFFLLSVFSCQDDDYDSVASDQSKKVLNIDNLTGGEDYTRQYNLSSLKTQKAFDFWKNDEWFYQFADEKDDCKRNLSIQFNKKHKGFSFFIPKCRGREEEEITAFFEIEDDKTISLEFTDWKSGEFIKNGRKGTLKNVKIDIEPETKNNSRKHVVSFTSDDVLEGHELEFVGKGY